MEERQKTIAYIVPHTHWDREWRYPIWKTRVLLIEFMDQVLDLMDKDPEYKQFVMDGQSVIIEDYLEIKPENKEKVCRYIKEGRIAIGPWYTLPDLYPVDGECIVRNLLKGSRVSKGLGRCIKLGYTSFGWGQTAQLPQIYAGFGIDFIITAKHVSKERAPQSEFWWESPDGTRVLTTRLGDGTRHNFFMTAVISAKYGVKYYGDYKFDWRKSNAIYHKANSEDSYEDYFKLDIHDTYHPEVIRKAMQSTWDATNDTALKSIRLLLAGCDFTGPMPELKDIIKDANNTFKDKVFIHGSIEEYAEKVKQNINGAKLKVIRGELRDGPAISCTANALATRIYVKQLNKKVQNILIHKAEPLASILSMMGKEYPTTFLNKAWEYLLKAHPHDSINGVTQDKTVEDTVYRLNQALEIADALYEKSIAELIQLIDLSKYAPEDILLVAVNPLPVSVRDVVKVCVDIPREYDVWDFTVTDSKGSKIDVQYVSRQEKTVPVHDLHARPWPFYVDRHIFYMDTGDIPAGGYKVFKVEPWKKFDRKVLFGPTPMRVSNGQEISKTHNTLENEYLRVEVRSNGTLCIKDKITGRVYEGLHHFEETGDVGDYWVYHPPYNNKTFTSHGCAAKIWCEDNGNLSATLGIQIKMEIPVCGIRPDNGINTESKRSNEQTIMTISSFITLKRSARRLDIKVQVNNTAEDHRLRVMYPTGIKTEFAYASGHFTVDKRPVLPQEGDDSDFYPEMQTLPQQSFIDISDGNEGLAFINNSLTEYEVRNDGDTTLALTLFRSVRNIICTEMRVTSNFPEQKGSQSPGIREYEYSIYPHKGGWEEERVYTETGKFNIPVTVYQTSAHNIGSLPEEESLFAIEPDNLVLSAFKKAEDRDSYILRVFNPTDKTIEGKLKVFTELKGAYLTNLNEERIGELEVVRQRIVQLSVDSNKIVTIELEI